MAMKPAYITGASAKVKIAGVTLAYCTDVSYSVSVQTIPIESMGKFEVHSNEPVSYSVDGSFSIIRYTKKAKELAGGNAAANGNSPAKIAAGSTSVKEHLDPGLILTSETFDLDILQKAATTVSATDATDETSFLRVQDCRVVRRVGSINKRGVLVEQYSFVGVMLHDSATDNADKVAPSGYTDLSTT